MPEKPKRLCAYPGCSEIVSKGYCETHSKQKQRSNESKRMTSHQRGYDRSWRKYRIQFLKSNPLCKHCEDEGKVEKASVVDHIVPHKGNKRLFWDRKNHQPLCKCCHDRKTASEDGGFGNSFLRG